MLLTLSFHLYVTSCCGVVHVPYSILNFMTYLKIQDRKFAAKFLMCKREIRCAFYNR